MSVSRVECLTPKQERFVAEFLIDCNGTQAAIRAGYSKKSARQIASELLTKEPVQAAIRAGMVKLADQNTITASRVLKELGEIAFSDVFEFGPDGPKLKPLAMISPTAGRAVAGLKIRRELGGEDKPDAEVVEFKMWDKGDALRQLAQHLGLLHEVESLLARIRVLENAQIDNGHLVGGESASPGAGETPRSGSSKK